MIRPVITGDSESIARIYNHYVTDTVVTFEERAVPTNEMATRIAEVASASLPWLVVEDAGQILGYAYASKWKGRCAYRHTVETTIYLDGAHVGRGIGTRLLENLLSTLAERGLHVVIAGIALPNSSSIALHERFGFAKVAHFREVGFKFGEWIDVGYWQKTL